MILNEIRIVGNLTSDPQTRLTPKGHQVVDIRLGVNEPYGAQNGERRQVTTFVNVRFWGPSGQHLAELAKKGAEIFVEGKLREFRWEDAQTGEERSKLYVKGEWWQFTQYRNRTPRGWDQIEGGTETPKAPTDVPQEQPSSTESAVPEAIAAEAPAPTVEDAPVPAAPAAAERKIAKRAKKAA